MSSAAWRRVLRLVPAGLAFLLVATLNSGGYRYGASDQAFYIPAIERHLDATLFPRDAPLIDSQSRLFVLDEALAGVVRHTGIGLPRLFLAGYVLTLALLFAAYVALGRLWLGDAWAVAALLAVATLRHRIAKTGANTLEGYFHPRLLAFAIGLLGVLACLRGRPWLALGLVAAAGLVHPTTAVWFAIWIGVALVADDERARPVVLAAGAVAGVAGCLFLWIGPLGLTVMDRAWVETLADKDYVFPTAWPASAWLMNLAYPVVILGSYAWRARHGFALPRERGVVFGLVALVLVFLASLPFVASRVALAVQLQVSRVFWMADVLALLYLVWWACGARATRGGRRARAVALLLIVLAGARGWYVLRVEHPGRPLAQVGLPADEWTDVSAWVRLHTPSGAHVLADPGHAWRYGSSLRVSASRDVFLENVKDGSIGMYDRSIALRVAERRAALGDWDAAAPGAWRALAARYDLSYVISEQPQSLTELYRNARFRVYRLSP